MGEFIPMLICFAILAFVLIKVAWPTILDMLDKRVNTIKDNLAAAEASRLETAEILEQERLELTAARNQASQIIAEARLAAEATKAEIEAQAAAQAEAMLTRARMVIEAEKAQAISELKESVADLTLALTRRLISSDFDEAEHRRIIEGYVAQAGSFYDN
jgi:F-type H+-transporting ATPase subunit b